MSTLSIDVKFPRHTKIAPLSDAAFRLHLSALAFCAEHETDGFVPESEVGTLTKHPNKTRLTNELEGATGAREDGQPLWRRSARGKVTGWEIHDYLEWNESHAILEAKREQAKVRMRGRRSPGVRANVQDNEQRTFDELIANDSANNAITHTVVSGSPARAGGISLQVSTSKDPDDLGDPDPTSHRARGGRGATLPEAWGPTEADHAFAAKRGWTAERVADEAVHFAAHHRAKGTISKNWAASWMTWVMQGLRFERASGVQRVNQPRAKPGDYDWRAEAEAKRNLGGGE